MQAEIALRALLMQASAVTTLVGARCYPLELPQDCLLPGLVTEHISTVSNKPVNPSTSSRTETTRVSVHVIATDYPTVQTLLPLIRSACHGFRGLVSGVQVGHVSAELIGPALRDDDQALFSQSIDFLITTYL